MAIRCIHCYRALAVFGCMLTTNARTHYFAGAGALVAGTCWQPSVNFFHDVLGCSFTGAAFGTFAVCGTMFLGALRAGRQSMPWMPGCDKENMKQVTIPCVLEFLTSMRWPLIGYTWYRRVARRNPNHAWFGVSSSFSFSPVPTLSVGCGTFDFDWRSHRLLRCHRHVIFGYRWRG